MRPLIIETTKNGINVRDPEKGSKQSHVRVGTADDFAIYAITPDSDRGLAFPKVERAEGVSTDWRLAVRHGGSWRLRYQCGGGRHFVARFTRTWKQRTNESGSS